MMIEIASRFEIKKFLKKSIFAQLQPKRAVLKWFWGCLHSDISIIIYHYPRSFLHPDLSFPLQGSFFA